MCDQSHETAEQKLICLLHFHISTLHLFIGKRNLPDEKPDFRFPTSGLRLLEHSTHDSTGLIRFYNLEKVKGHHENQRPRRSKQKQISQFTMNFRQHRDFSSKCVFPNLVPSSSTNASRNFKYNIYSTTEMKFPDRNYILRPFAVCWCLFLSPSLQHKLLHEHRLWRILFLWWPSPSSELWDSQLLHYAAADFSHSQVLESLPIQKQLQLYYDRKNITKKFCQIFWNK